MAYCSAFHNNLNDFRRDEKYCDVVVRVQNRRFPCHRVILASSSTYFNAMFSNNFREKDAYEIVLHGIDAVIFEAILNSVYIGQECNIRKSDILNFLRASSFLGISSIERTCIHFIICNNSEIREDHFEIFDFACSMNIANLIFYFIRRTPSFFNDDRFLEMEFKNLKLLLDYWVTAPLPFHHENVLLRLLIRWVHYAPEERRKYFEELIRVIDFEKVSTKSIPLMLQYFDNLINLSDLEETSAMNIASILIDEESESNHFPLDSSFSTQDSKNRLMLQRKIQEYFTLNKTLSGNYEDLIIPVSSSNPWIRDDALGLHVCVKFAESRNTSDIRVVKYSPDTEVPVKCLKDTNIFSINKYQPEWSFSCETSAWHSCKRYCIVPQKSHNLLYCVKTFEDDRFFRQTFCTYSSADLKLALNVLAPPPITLKRWGFEMCAVPQGYIYLLHSKASVETHAPRANSLFSTEDIDRGFYRYNCELDKWFPTPEIQFQRTGAHLTVEGNLVYIISQPRGFNPATIVQALDHRMAAWITLPSGHVYSYPHCKPSSDRRGRCCTLDGNIYFSDEHRIERYNLTGGMWEEVAAVREEYIQWMLPYENRLWLLCTPHWQPSDYDNVSRHFLKFHPTSDEWLSSPSLNECILNRAPKNVSSNLLTYCIQDVFTF